MKTNNIFQKNYKSKLLAIALSVMILFAAFFSVSLILKDKTTNASSVLQKTDMEIGDVYISQNLFFIGGTKSGQHSLSCKNLYSAEESWTYQTESYIRKIRAFENTLAVVLENNKVIFLTKDGIFLSESEFLYPVVDIDLDMQNEVLAVACSVTQATNAVFVIESFDAQKNYGIRNYTYFVSSNIYPIGVSVVNGEVYFAGSNSTLYRCLKTGKASIVLDSYYTQNSFIGLDGYFILGYVNGIIDVFSFSEGEYELEERLLLGSKEVLLSYQKGENLFCAAEKGGKLAFYDINDFKCKAKGEGATLVSKLSQSNGCAVLVKNHSLIFADESLLIVSQVFSILYIPALILLILSMLWCAYRIACMLPKHGEAVHAYVSELGRDLWRDKKIYMLLLPAFAFMYIFVFWPIIQGFLIAFLDYVPGVKAEWVGFKNFAEVFQNTYFWGSMKNMLVFLFTDLLKALIPPFIIAECIIALLSKRSQYVARVLMYIPGILPGLAGVLIWTNGILGAEGVLSQLLGAIGFKQYQNFNWLGNSSTALGSLILIGFPWVGSYLILYGALMSIPREYYDAAKLDGFNWFKRIIFIDLPMIRPQLKYIFVLSFIGSIQDFQRVYMTTGGAFNTNIPALEIYYNISTFNNYGAAAAMGVLLFAIIFVATLLNLRIKSKD